MSSAGPSSLVKVNKNRPTALISIAVLLVVEAVLFYLWNSYQRPAVPVLMTLVALPLLFSLYDAIWGIRNRSAKLAAGPMMLIVVCVFVGGTVWTVLFSFTNILIQGIRCDPP